MFENVAAMCNLFAGSCASKALDEDWSVVVEKFVQRCENETWLACENETWLARKGLSPSVRQQDFVDFKGPNTYFRQWDPPWSGKKDDDFQRTN